MKATLGSAIVVWSAAVIGIGAAIISVPQAFGWYEQEAATNVMVRVADVEESYRRMQQSSRAVQRARIEARYEVDRARCGALGGFKRDKCLVFAHAGRSRSTLEAAGPYEFGF